MSPTDDSDDINALLANIPQSANMLGEPVAPVTLEYFGDLECPFCRDFSLDVLPSIIQTVGAHRQVANCVPRVADGNARA